MSTEYSFYQKKFRESFQNSKISNFHRGYYFLTLYFIFSYFSSEINLFGLFFKIFQNNKGVQ